MRARRSRVENRRRYSLAADSLAQRDFLDDHGGSLTTSARREVAGRLRSDSLLARELVFTDNQILDGAVMLALGPQRLTSLVARPGRDGPEAPITIVGREASLSASLLAMFLSEGDFLRRFELSSLNLPLEARLAVEERMAQVPCRRLLDLVATSSVPKAVGRLLAEHGEVPEGVVAPLVDAWEAWLAVEQAAAVRMVQWTVKGNFEASLSASPPASLAHELRTSEGRCLLDRVVAAAHQRTEVRRLAAPLRQAGGEQQQDSELICAWHEWVYQRAIAWGQECHFVGEPPAQLLRARQGQRLYAEAQSRLPDVNLSDKVVGVLADMPDEEFRHTLYRVRDPLRAWWDTSDVASLRQAVEVLDSETASGSEPWRSALSGLELTVVAMSGSVGATVAGPVVGALVGVGEVALTRAVKSAAASWQRRAQVVYHRGG